MNNDKKSIMAGSGCLIFIIIIILFFGSFKTIKSGEIGLKVRFGKIVDTELTEGVNFKIPFIEKIVKVNTKVQKSELKTEASTKDLQIVNASVVVNYRIDINKAVQLYKTVGTDYNNTVLLPAIKESIKTAIAGYNAEEITTNRKTVSDNCLNTIQEKVLKYGIVIEDFNLTDFGFTDEYTRAIEQKQVAEQNLEKAKLDAEKKLVEANAEKQANELKNQTLTDQVLQEKLIEKWNGSLPSYYGGESGLFKLFGLDK